VRINVNKSGKSHFSLQFSTITLQLRILTSLVVDMWITTRPLSPCMKKNTKEHLQINVKGTNKEQTYLYREKRREREDLARATCTVI
jgi:hypothetical protein